MIFEIKSDILSKADKLVKKSEIEKLITQFCDQFLNEEYFSLCSKVLTKLSRKRTVPFTSGSINSWAGAIVYAIGQTNFLFDKKSNLYVSYDQIEKFFLVKKTTLSQKAKTIRDMLKIDYFNPDYLLRSIQKSNPLLNMSMTSDGFLIQNSFIEKHHPGLILFKELRKFIPFQVKIRIEALKILQEKNHIKISDSDILSVIDLSYQPPIPGIICQIKYDNMLINISIIYLLFEQDFPLVNEIIEYQSFVISR